VDCQVGTQNCAAVIPGFCGDGRINDAEQCDGVRFGLIDECSDLPQFEGGFLRCGGDCVIDTGNCVKIPNCGDGVLDSGELCDGFEFGAIDECTDFNNFVGGDLDCTSTCFLDTGGCLDVPTCGNGVIDLGEDCEENLFGSIDECVDYPEFNFGVLICSSLTCQLDTSGCREKPNCGNGIIDSGESCDGVNLGPLDGSCASYDPLFFTGGDLRCSSSCQLDSSQCFGVSGGSCNDGFVNVGEECENDHFGAIDECSDFVDFVGGTLLCSSCRLNTNGCVAGPDCGNGVVDVGESCDGVNFGSVGGNCNDYSSFFSGGVLTCTSRCQLDTGSCLVAPTCGNSFVDEGEQCDGVVLLVSWIVLNVLVFLVVVVMMVLLMLVRVVMVSILEVLVVIVMIIVRF